MLISKMTMVLSYLDSKPQGRHEQQDKPTYTQTNAPFLKQSLPKMLKGIKLYSYEGLFSFLQQYTSLNELPQILLFPQCSDHSTQENACFANTRRAMQMHFLLCTMYLPVNMGNSCPSTFSAIRSNLDSYVKHVD